VSDVVLRLAYQIPAALAILGFVSWLVGEATPVHSSVPWDNGPSPSYGFLFPTTMPLLIAALIGFVVVASLRRPPVDMAVPTPRG
jgi:hypothetical protein